tara:strand:+ start:7065 stop:8624 length:1560 start_codon:yes stop_codon:yes gene_type:complete
MVDDDYGGDGGIEDDPGAGSSVSGDVASDPGPSPDESESFEPDLSRSDWSPGDLTFEGMDVAPGPGGFSPGGAEGYWGGDGEPGPDWSPAETDPFSTNLGGIGSLTGDSPDLATILTAPLEALISFFTFGLVDPEFTGKDVFSLPGASSSDFSRAIEGKQGPQPVGVEVGLPMIGGFEWSPGSDARGTGIFAGDKEAPFSPSKSVPTDMLTTFKDTIAKSGAPKEVQELAAEKVNAAASAAQNLATNYQQMDTRYTPTPLTADQQARVDNFYMDQARNEAGTFAPSTSPVGSQPGASAPAVPPEDRAAAMTEAIGGGPVSYDVSGLGSAGSIPPGYSTLGTSQPGAQPGWNPIVQSRIPGRSVFSPDLQYAGDRAILGEYPVDSGKHLMDPTIQAREDLARQAVMEKMAMQQPPAYRDMSAPYDPMADARARQDARHQAAEYQRAADMFRQDLGTPVLGFNDPDTLAVQRAGDKMRSFLSDVWSKVSNPNLTPGRYAGGGSVRGPVTGGQRSRGIMSLR